ncbi:MAG TPA: thioredoxin family protein [Candidatus Saccharimonadales bacterium]|nr:thioredoxin family protein [Candidatus Saccharimonadales bacterium]
MRQLVVLFAILFLSPLAFAQALTPSFPAFDQWRAAVLSGDSDALAALYSPTAETKVGGPDGKDVPLPDELSFWSSLKSKGLTDLGSEIVQEENPREDIHVLVQQVTLTFKPGSNPQREYVILSQAWGLSDNRWRLVFSSHNTPTRLRQPTDRKTIYSAGANPAQEIAEAVRAATASHKRILLVFGGNWCFDCHVLDDAFHSPEIAPTLNKSFLVVHVDIGEMNKNLDVAKKYDVPLDRGVPAIAVLDSGGKLLFSQKRGEFEAARSMAPEDILAFLHQWQPAN